MKKHYLQQFLLVNLIGFSSSSLTAQIELEKLYDVSQKDSLVEFGKSHKSYFLPDDIQILVWNIYKQKKTSFFHDYRNLPHPFDLVLIQEVYMTNHFYDFLLSFHGTSYAHAISFFTKKHISTGVMTGSPVKSFKTIVQRTKKKEPIVRTPKTQILTYYELAPFYEPLLVINIHALNFRTFRSTKKQLKMTSNYLKDHKGPIIFAGDFNNWTQSRQKVVTKFFSKRKFQKVKFSKKLITDHVYIRGLKVNSSKFFNLKGSDHPALVVNLSVK